MTITLNRSVITKSHKIRVGLAEFQASANDQKLKEQQRDAVKALFAELNCDGALPQQWTKSEAGGPIFPGSDWRITISHSGRFVAIALSQDGQIGIDIQLEQNNKSAEYAEFLRWPEKQFFYRWCLYEAVYKAERNKCKNLINKMSQINIPSATVPFGCRGLSALCWSPITGLNAALVCNENLLTNSICTNLKFRPL